MDKAELLEKMKQFVSEQGTYRDEWYVSERTAAVSILSDFLIESGIGTEGDVEQLYSLNP